MHYRLTYCTDKTEAGTDDDQSLDYDSLLQDDDPRRIFNYIMKKVPTGQEIVSPRPILVKKAKLTDLIKTAFGNSLWLIMSDKLKNIICSTGYDGIQVFPTSIIKNNEDIPGYWITHASGFRYEYIDFDKTKCSLRGLGDTILEPIKINDSRHFKEYREQLQWPTRLGIDRLKLVSEIPEDFFILAYIDGGIGYFVSERLKKKIETAGCTGLAFIPADMKISEFLDERLKKEALNDTKKVDGTLPDAALSPEQRHWLFLKGNQKEVPFITQIWGEERHYEPEKSDIVLRISIDAWRRGFLDTWDESTIDRVLSENLPEEDHPYIDVYKQRLQLQMRFMEQDYPTEPVFRHFLRSNLEVLLDGFELQMMQPIDGAKIFDTNNRCIYLFKKGWPSGSLVLLSEYKGDDIPDTVDLVIGD